MSQSASWRDVLALLMRPSGSKTKKSQEQKSCPLLDTVFFLDDGPEWYYTTKSGAVTRKSGDAAAAVAIVNRFSKFALANPNNTSKYVATLFLANGYRQHIKLEDFEDLLTNNTAAISTKGSFLQVYLRPHRGKEEMLRVVYQRNHSSGNEAVIDVSVLPSRPPGGNSAALAITAQVKRYLQEIADELEASYELFLSDASIDFIVDDNEQAWLSNASNFSYIPVDPSWTKTKRSPISVDAPSEKAVPSVTNTAISSSSTRPGTAPIGCSFIDLDPRDVIYKTSLCVDELPGLRAWVPQKINVNNVLMGGVQVGPQWIVDLDEYTRPLASPVEALEQIRESRSRLSHRVPIDLVKIVTRCENILLGSVPCRSTGDLITAWKRAVSDAEKTLHQGTEGESCLVCGNLNEVLEKLTSLIQSDFCVVSEPDVPSSRPRSVPLINVGENTSSSGTLGRENSAHDRHNAIPSSSSAAVGGSEPKILRAQSSQEQNRTSSGKINISTSGELLSSEYSSVSRKDILRVNEQLEPLQTKPVDVITNKVGQRYDQINALYSEEPSKRNLSRNATKGKKLNDKLSQQKMFGKNSMQAPPNLELIAKFAVEKEKIKSELDKAETKSSIAGKAGGKKKSLRNDHPIEKGSIKGGQRVDFAQDYEQPYGYGEGSFDADDGSVVMTMDRRIKMEEEFYKNGLEDIPHLGFPFPGVQVHGMGSVSTLGGGLSVISGSEANFMLRQAESGDISQLSITGQEEAFAVDAASIAAATGSGLAEKVNEKMKDRIASLEKQVKALTGTVERRDQELEKAREREVKILSDLETTRKDSMRELHAFRERYETEILNLKETHAREMAVLIIPANDKSSEQRVDSPSKAKKVGGSKSSAIEGNALLLQQLEEMRQELRKNHEITDHEKRLLKAESAAKLASQEKQLKSEIASLKSEIASFEDRYSALNDDLQDSRAQQEAMLRTCQQLERSRQDALDMQSKLRADLSNMQQTVNATYRLESSQGLGVGVDADTAIRLNEAKFEAKERQLQNKLEFLKAQLAAEQEASEELKRAISAGKQKFDEFKQEFNLRMRESETLKRQAVEDTERRLETQFEERMAELTTLQARVSGLQNQLQDASQDVALARQREEAAKSATAKAMAHQASTRAEAEMLRSQVEELRKQRDEIAEKESNKHTNEAIMRRLDNERQYLKSQLASEITHKNELQTTLSQCQQQLAEIQRQWKSDVDALRDTLSANQRESLQIEQDLTAKNVNFESENIRLAGQVKELKDITTKMRDQYRVDQITMENLKTSNKTLQSDVDSAKAEVAQYHQKEAQDAQLHKKQIMALTLAVEEIEQKKDKEISTLKDELGKQYAAISDAQKGMLVLRDQVGQQRNLSGKSVCTYQVVDLVRRWKRSRIFSAFRTWSTNSTLIGVAAQFREQVEVMIEEMKNDFVAEKVVAAEELRERLKTEEEARVAQLIGEYDVLIAKTRKDLDDERAIALDEAYEEFQRHIDEKESAWGEERRHLNAVSEQNLENAVARKQVELEEYQYLVKHQLEESEIEAQNRVNQAIAETTKNNAQEWGNALKAREDELSKQFLAERVEAFKEAEIKHATLEKEFNELLAKTRFDAENTLLKEISRVKDVCTNEANLREEELKRAHLRQEENIRDECHDSIRTFKAESHENFEKRIRVLREQWNAEMNSAVAAKAAELDELVKMRLTEQASVHDKEVQSAVKLEAAKWQQAMRDAEKRYALEAKKAHSQGYSQREQELQDEIQRLQISHTMEMTRKLDLQQRAFNETIEEHAASLVKTKNELEKDKSDSIQKRERELTNTLNQEWSERMKTKVDEAWADCASVWQAKMDRESERLESFKSDSLKQSQRLAEERTELMSRVAKSDEILRSVEAMNATEMSSVRNEFDKERQLMVGKYEKEKKDLIDNYEAQLKSIRESMERTFAADIQEMVKQERERVTDQMNVVMSQLEKEKDRSIKALETAISEQKSRVADLTSELATTHNKLQETEDALYDAQQEKKTSDKQNSITLWRLFTSIFRMQNRFREGLVDMENDAKAELDRVQEKSFKEMNEMKLNVLKLSSCLVNVEASRKKIHGFIVSYKTESLIERRSQIKQLEKEIDKLTTERDALEENRDNAEDEIANLEVQVGDLEEQIRDHNRTSTMQNGRVNVAHARKKRRLDSELERVLETIEQKRAHMVTIDNKLTDTTRVRDEKENELIDVEKELVGILVEQQKHVLGQLDEIKEMDDKNRTVLTVANFYWPPPMEPTIKDVGRQAAF